MKIARFSIILLIFTIFLSISCFAYNSSLNSYNFSDENIPYLSSYSNDAATFDSSFLCYSVVNSYDNQTVYVSLFTTSDDDIFVFGVTPAGRCYASSSSDDASIYRIIKRVYGNGSTTYSLSPISLYTYSSEYYLFYFYESGNTNTEITYYIPVYDSVSAGLYDLSNYLSSYNGYNLRSVTVSIGQIISVSTSVINIICHNMIFLMFLSIGIIFFAIYIIRKIII